jgi:PIN domain nuclease of toxin-antitoxin system
MRVLLDTNVLLWALAQPHRLDEGTCATIENGANEVVFSVASIWEIAIKAGLGRTDFAVKPARSPARPSTSGLSN